MIRFQLNQRNFFQSTDMAHHYLDNTHTMAGMLNSAWSRFSCGLFFRQRRRQWDRSLVVRGRGRGECNPWKVKVLHLQDWDYISFLINSDCSPWKVIQRDLEYHLQGWDFFFSVTTNPLRNETALKTMEDSTGLSSAGRHWQRLTGKLHDSK